MPPSILPPPIKTGPSGLQQALSAAQVIQNAVADLVPNMFVSVLSDLKQGDARDMLAEAHGERRDLNITMAQWAVVVVGGGGDAVLSVTLSASAYAQELIPNDDPHPGALTGLLTVNHLNRKAQITFRPIIAATLHKTLTQLCAQLGLVLDGRRMGGSHGT